jgi:hypothetical protein
MTRPVEPCPTCSQEALDVLARLALSEEVARAIRESVMSRVQTRAARVVGSTHETIPDVPVMCIVLRWTRGGWLPLPWTERSPDGVRKKILGLGRKAAREAAHLIVELR